MMKKKIIVAVVIVVVLIVACFAYIKINYPYALYYGDRLTGTYSSHVNGTTTALMHMKYPVFMTAKT